MNTNVLGISELKWTRMGEFNKAGYQINAQKSLAFLYTNNEKSEREIKESIPFAIKQKELHI